MSMTREIAETLAEERFLEILQKGKRVDLKSYKGPIRLRLLSSAADKERSKETEES